MRRIKKYRRQIRNTIICLLVLSLLPMAACGGTSAEATDPPKTVYELEQMIKDNTDAMKVLKTDITALETAVAGIQPKNYDSDIADIKARLKAIEEMLATPTPYPNGSQPTPLPTNTGTPPSGKITAIIDPDDKFLGEAGNYSFEIEIKNLTSTSVNPDILIEIRTNVPTDVTGTNAGGWDLDSYPNDGNCNILYLERESIGYIPPGGNHILMLELELKITDKVYWTPSISVK